MVERFVRDEEAVGSNPITPTDDPAHGGVVDRGAGAAREERRGARGAKEE